jgi:hypothetical protein
MSEPFLERLIRFTPNAGGLDRDALLFAAGRGSARPNRGWITLATLLANTQILSLVLLWPRPTSTPLQGRLTVAAGVDPVTLPRMTLEPQTSAALASAGTWSSRRRLVEPDKDELAVDSVTLIDSGPPLKVFGLIPPSLLN